MAELTIKFLKSEFCRFEENFKTLKVRIKVTDIWNVSEDNIFTAKIVTGITDPNNPESKLEYELTDWTETILETTTKLIKEYDLNLVTFDLGSQCEIDLPLNIGKHTLSVNINGTTTTETFDVVPITVQSMKNQYLLGIEFQSATELVFQQDLRLIKGIELLEISNETPVGQKQLVWNFDNKTLQWDDGEPVVISDEHLEYHLLNYMGSGLSIVDGDYIKIKIEDIDALPTENTSELVIVDVKQYTNEDFQYWINVGYQTVSQTIIMTELEPTLYSSSKELGYRYLDPVQDLPKKLSESSNFTFEFAVNKLQCIVDLWVQFFAATNRIGINNRVLEFSEDGQISVRGFPYGSSGFTSSSGGSSVTLGLAGQYDRTIYSNVDARSRNKTKNFFNATVVSGVPDTDKGLRDLIIEVSSSIAAISLLMAAAVSKGAGIASRSFSVGGISSSFQTTESPENHLYSGPVKGLQEKLGVGKATKEERQFGLVNQLKHKIEAGSMVFKY
jgi:hypothetical protein